MRQYMQKGFEKASYFTCFTWSFPTLLYLKFISQKGTVANLEAPLLEPNSFDLNTGSLIHQLHELGQVA